MTDMMLPRSNLIVYYIRQRDGVIIHDYIPLVFKAEVDSSVSFNIVNLSSICKITFDYS